MYWPYDEVSLELELHNNLVKVKSPWLEASLSSEVISKSDLITLSNGLNQQTLTGEHVPLVHQFFSLLEAYPFAYTLPSPKNSASDTHSLVDETLLSGDMKEVLEKIVAHCADHYIDFKASDIDALFDEMPRKEWQWDVEDALSLSRFMGRIHPESLFSVSKRYHLLEIMSTDVGRSVFEDVHAMSEHDFKKAVAHLVRQNHYVTEKCQRALEPAITVAQSASEEVRQFRKEENGHEKLLERSLLAMGETPSDIPVSVQTRALMMLLEFCARRNFLAFTMAVDAFERSNYSDVDPLAQLLMSRNMNEAAKYINAHKNINDHGEHENVAKQFLFAMDLCADDYAREALRLMELLSLTMCKVSNV